MIEKVFKYAIDNKGIIERIIDDENVNINHMIIKNGEGLPEHFSNSNVYMLVISGRLSLRLNEQEVQHYTKGDIISIPYDTKMNVRNEHEDNVEIFVVKAPAPQNYGK